MPIEIKSVKGFYFLEVWNMANIVQLATGRICRRILNRNNDLCGRQFDQMTQAARSITANIAEGCSRHQTSLQTEMKLLDVARASAAELAGDLFFLMLDLDIEPWPKDSDAARTLAAWRVTRPVLGDDWQRTIFLHIKTQYSLIAPWLEHDHLAIAFNAMVMLCNRVIVMLEKMLQARLSEFKANGGFTENLTQERMDAKRRLSIREGDPLFPKCGKPMIRRMTIKSGVKDP